MNIRDDEAEEARRNALANELDNLAGVPFGAILVCLGICLVILIVASLVHP